MNKLEQLLVTFAATTPGKWEEDNDGFIATGGRIVADSRCDVEPFADANTEFVILAHNSMTELLYGLKILHKLTLEDQKGGDAFAEFGPEARSALRKLGVPL